MSFYTKSRGLTDKGMVRKTNQDSYCLDNDRGSFIVADGMGGHAGGELASQMSIQIISAQLREQLSDPVGKDAQEISQILRMMDNSLNLASMKIYEKALEVPELQGMGTTVTLLQIVAGNACCAHVGDSRLYLMRSGFIYQMTSDHSLVWEQVDAGLITEEEARKHQLRNVITRSIGYQESEYVDTHSFSLNDQDYLLLCSDGLHGKVSDHEICRFVSEYEINAVDPLVALANERGGEDNITVLIIKVAVKK